MACWWGDESVDTGKCHCDDSGVLYRCDGSSKTYVQMNCGSYGGSSGTCPGSGGGGGGGGGGGANDCRAWNSCPATANGGKCACASDGYSYDCVYGNWYIGDVCGTPGNKTCTKNGTTVHTGEHICDPAARINYLCTDGNLTDAGACPGQIPVTPPTTCAGQGGCEGGKYYDGNDCVPNPNCGSTSCTFGGIMGIGATTLINGQTYCDSNGNNFKCINGVTTFLNSGCNTKKSCEGRGGCPDGQYMDVSIGGCYPIDGCPIASSGISEPKNAMVVKLTTTTPSGTASVKFSKVFTNATSLILDFGDGTTTDKSLTSTSTHMYSKTGTYTAILYAYDTKNNQETASVSINVTTPGSLTDLCGGKCSGLTPVCSGTTCVAKPTGPIPTTGCPTACTGQTCNKATGKCEPISGGGSGTNCPPCGTGTTCLTGASTCTKIVTGSGSGSGSGSGASTGTCKGLQKNGSYDVTCLLEEQNRNTLYAIGGVVLVLLVMLQMNN